jgi:nucleotide-binding universal stress UspA family protein
LTVVVAGGGKGYERVGVDAVQNDLEDLDYEIRVEQGAPVDALRKASEDADLLVVGSRGLHGLRALGSVSERVAHEARCSVLVVRSTEATLEPR